MCAYVFIRDKEKLLAPRQYDPCRHQQIASLLQRAFQEARSERLGKETTRKDESASGQEAESSAANPKGDQGSEEACSARGRL